MKKQHAPPPSLSKTAASVWREFQPRFQIDDTDQPAFEMFCESFAAWRSLLKAAAEKGPIVRDQGQAIQNPHLVRADREAEKCRKLIIDLKAAVSAKEFMRDEP